MTEPSPGQALGGFLRAHREGLPRPPSASTRRRTPGWRREELAEACGLSLTWITWLEQGRPVSASPAALLRLAQVLRLSAAERAYLFELSGKRDPEPVRIDAQLPDAVRMLPEQILVPAYVLDRSWSAVAWNAPARRLFPGWLDGDHDRSLLRYVFLSPASRRLMGDWEQRARRLVAEFRADVSRSLRQPAVLALITDLTQRSPAFAALWRQHEVLGREGGERRFLRPARRYFQSSFILSSQSDITLVTLTPSPER